MSDDRLRIWLGFCLLGVLALLAALVALGHVNQEDSFGLDSIVGGLLTMTGGFSNWAFQHLRGEHRSDEQDRDDGGHVP